MRIQSAQVYFATDPRKLSSQFYFTFKATPNLDKASHSYLHPLDGTLITQNGRNTRCLGNSLAAKTCSTHLRSFL